MIIDKIENWKKYEKLHPAFSEVFRTLEKLTAASPCEKTPIDGERAFINLSSYVNRPAEQCAFEVHRKYIDIQYVVKGHEHIDFCPAAELEITDDRMDSGDIAFYAAPEGFSTADLKEGFFAVIFPLEAHRPMVAPNGSGVETVKAVAKILSE